MLDKQIPLLLFAKAPIAGKVKTRLTTHCSEHQAAEIAKILIDESLKVAVHYWPGRVLLSVWQQREHIFIKDMLRKYRVELHRQVSGDLGKKMHAAFASVGYPAAILGCDTPVIEPDSLAMTHSLLSDGSNAIGPSMDGGYYLIALSQPAPALFRDIEWGKSSVFSQSMNKARESNIDVEALPKNYDIDHWQDVLKASKQIPQLKQYLLTENLLAN